MSKPRNHRWSVRSVERRVAPHIDPSWAEAMLLELRLLGVDGPQIGSALAEVDSHCTESGQTAEEAFGDPSAYARSLGLPAEDDISLKALLWSAVPVLVQVLGMQLLLPSFAAWRKSTLAQFSVGTLVSLGLILLLVLAAARWIDLVVRTAVKHPLATWATSVATLVLFVAAQLLFPTNALEVPAVWAIALSLLLLVTGTAWGLASQGSDQTDEVVAPLTTSPSRSATRGLIGVLTFGSVPIATVCFVALSWWMTG